MKEKPSVPRVTPSLEPAPLRRDELARLTAATGTRALAAHPRMRFAVRAHGEPPLVDDAAVAPSRRGTA